MCCVLMGGRQSFSPATRSQGHQRPQRPVAHMFQTGEQAMSMSVVFGKFNIS